MFTHGRFHPRFTCGYVHDPQALQSSSTPTALTDMGMVSPFWQAAVGALALMGGPGGVLPASATQLQGVLVGPLRARRARVQPGRHGAGHVDVPALRHRQVQLDGRQQAHHRSRKGHPVRPNVQFQCQLRNQRNSTP
eukprot:4776372-Pyramimonas_sp.AAC.1